MVGMPQRQCGICARKRIVNIVFNKDHGSLKNVVSSKIWRPFWKMAQWHKRWFQIWKGYQLFRCNWKEKHILSKGIMEVIAYNIQRWWQPSGGSAIKDISDDKLKMQRCKGGAMRWKVHRKCCLWPFFTWKNTQRWKEDRYRLNEDRKIERILIYILMRFRNRALYGRT